VREEAAAERHSSTGTKMNRLERTIIGIFISFACAVSFLVAGWWISASLSIYHLLAISEQGIATAAFAGLGLGILLNLLCLRIWIARFYNVAWPLAVLIYLFWLAIATASFMGLPIGTLILGILAGLYLGRRQRHAGSSTIAFARHAKRASLLVAMITGTSSLGIGILALGEESVLASIQKLAGTNPGAITLVAGACIVLVSCMVLVILQFWGTSRAAAFAYRLTQQT
jgi:hypothetical protein